MRLFIGRNATPFAPALVDSGADYATFDASVAEYLGIDYKSGLETTIMGIGTKKPDPNASPEEQKKVGIPVWVHEGFGLALKDSEGNRAAISLRVGFAVDLPIAGIVGRDCFFEAFDVTFKEADRQVILELREDAPNVIDWADVPIYKPPLPEHMRSKKRKR